LFIYFSSLACIFVPILYEYSCMYMYY
jgi:hypothetical protein